MALRNVSLITVGAVGAALVLGWGLSNLRPSDPSIEIQEVSDSAWRVEVEEVPTQQGVVQQGAAATETASN